jgi:hypothetical protein
MRLAASQAEPVARNFRPGDENALETANFDPFQFNE